MPRTAVLLIPGFFGYSTFGDPAHPILEYFAGVEAVLSPKLPDHVIVAHGPPPTGSLQSRARSLFVAIDKLLRGQKLPNAAQAFEADRVHLVGHSTGGVDARLFANPAFDLGADVPQARRLEMIARLGNIVTVSAPFYGTPIADHIGNDDRLLLEAVRILTILGVFTHGDLVRFGIELVKLTPMAVARDPLAALGALLKAFDPPVSMHDLARLVVQKASGTTAPALLVDALRSGKTPTQRDVVVKQLSEFFNSIETHQELLPELAPGSIQPRTAELVATDYGRDGKGKIVSYVSVSPPPANSVRAVIESFAKLEVLQRFVYDTLYQAASGAAIDRPVPEGRLLSQSANAEALLADAKASDGVVPARSQTLDGKAAGIVVGDHLDVVGSFDGGTGANVMRSGANFSGSDFEALWGDVANSLER